MPMREHRARVNGWNRPFHVLQVVSWVSFSLVTAAGYPLFLAYLVDANTVLGIVITVIYAIFAIATVAADVIAATTDASDPACSAAHVPTRNNPKGASDAATQAAPATKRCYTAQCRHFVHESSEHCGLCGRCALGFDHHCFWLNNCVGVKNYRMFLSLLVTATVQISIQSVVGIWALVDHFSSDEAQQHQRLGAMLGCSTKDGANTCISSGLSPTAWVILVFVFLFIQLVLLGNLIHLLGFHIMLLRRGQTTNQYLSDLALARQRRADEREEALARQRVAQMQAAGPSVQITPSYSAVAKAESAEDAAGSGAEQAAAGYGLAAGAGAGGYGEDEHKVPVGTEGASIAATQGSAGAGVGLGDGVNVSVEGDDDDDDAGEAAALVAQADADVLDEAEAEAAAAAEADVAAAGGAAGDAVGEGAAAAETAAAAVDDDGSDGGGGGGDSPVDGITVNAVAGDDTPQPEAEAEAGAGAGAAAAIEAAVEAEAEAEAGAGAGAGVGASAEVEAGGAEVAADASAAVTVPGSVRTSDVAADVSDAAKAASTE